MTPTFGSLFSGIGGFRSWLAARGLVLRVAVRD